MTGQMKVISSMATRRVLQDLVGLFAHRSACTVEVESMGGVDVARTVRAGKNADVVVVASSVLMELEAEGHIIAGSRRDFTRSDITIAVRSCSPTPVIDDEAAVKRAITNSGRICFSTGPSGDHLKRLLERWGMTDSLRQAIQAPVGVPVAEILARGDADLGFQQLSELLGFPRVDILGPLPPEIQATTIFSAGILCTSTAPENARSLIGFLISLETASEKQRHGMGVPSN